MLCDLGQFGILKVSGEEAQNFLQNLLSRTLRSDLWGQALASVAFGFSHVLLAPAPNWRYVALASLAGWFYGSAFRQSGNLVGPALIMVWELHNDLVATLDAGLRTRSESVIDHLTAEDSPANESISGLRPAELGETDARAMEIEDLTPLDFCILSHYHGDHFVNG